MEQSDANKSGRTATTASLIYGSIGSLKRLGLLYFEALRLKTTDKLTVLLSSIAYVGVMLALGLVCLVFISIGIGHLLATTVAPHLAYLFIAAFYLLLFALAFVFKRHIFVNPISRFMSRLLVEEPEEERERKITGMTQGIDPTEAASPTTPLNDSSTKLPDHDTE